MTFVPLSLSLSLSLYASLSIVRFWHAIKKRKQFNKATLTLLEIVWRDTADEFRYLVTQLPMSHLLVSVCAPIGPLTETTQNRFRLSLFAIPAGRGDT